MWVLFWVLFSVAVGVFASNRGRSGFGWFLLSLFISPVLSLLFVAVMKNLATEGVAHAPSLQTHVKCPACAEFVLPDAKVCKHCGAALTPETGFAERIQREKDEAESADRKALWLWGFGIVALAAVLGSLSNCSR